MRAVEKRSFGSLLRISPVFVPDKAVTARASTSALPPVASRFPRVDNPCESVPSFALGKRYMSDRFSTEESLRLLRDPYRLRPLS